jgi:hypothetical protein
MLFLNTYSREAFNDPTSQTPQPRTVCTGHASCMASVMANYSTAYVHAKKIESDHGGFIVEQSRGSAHGSSEILCRMLASRFRCLIWAVSRGEDELEGAEAEALRLTERHWFKKLEEEGQRRKPYG